MDKTLKEKLGIVEIADIETLFDALAPWEKTEFIFNHANLLAEEGMDRREFVDVLGEDKILKYISDTAIANYVLEHKQVLKRIFARIVKENRIK